MKRIFLFIFVFNSNFCTAQNSDSLGGFTILPFEKHIRINIIGNWKDQNSKISYFNNESYLIKYDNGQREIGKWRLKDRQLFLSANGTSVDEVYNIIHFTVSTMKTQLANGSDSTIWIARKIKKKIK